MSTLDDVHHLIHSGRFSSALVSLRTLNSSSSERFSIDATRAFLLERIGQHSQSRALADRLLREDVGEPTDRSLLEQTLGSLAVEAGRFDSARIHLQRAVVLAHEAADAARLCSSQLRLWVFLCDDESPDAAAPLLRELRDSTVHAGQAMFTAGLHAYVGESEAKRGLVDSARWHTRIALKILERHDNPWLEAVGENTLVAVALMRSDYRSALAHGVRAVALAEQSGVAASMRACLGNLGNAFFLRGEYEAARRHLEQARTCLGLLGENASANNDSLARICLAEGDVNGCSELLDRIEASIRRPDDRSLPAYRYTCLTRAQLELRRRLLPTALDRIDETLHLAEGARDRRLLALARAVRGEILVALDEVAGATDQAKLVAGLFGYSDVDVYGHYLRLCTLISAKTGDHSGALAHYLSAKRIYSSTGDVRGLMELAAAVREIIPQVESCSSSEMPEVDRCRDVLSGVSTILRFPDRPEIVASEAERLLRAADAIVPGSFEWQAGESKMPERPQPAMMARRAVLIGGRPIEFRVAVRDGVGPLSAVDAAFAVIDGAAAVASYRENCDAEAAIWPKEQAPIESDSVVTSGRMRELLTLCSRVARTNVTVLITGESGTGKEILARAIHGFSPRAAHPFLPFNCTAIPRDLVEGQLFGHRRGAFTGAERDYPGIVRAAAGGTLFLDEIGEFSLDMQPKLLRFLECGEILPLGETQPAKIDVRVVAATNRELEQLVAAGLFREDLFYRLNVVRLKVPPLRERRDEIPALVEHFVRQAAQEFEKGDIRVSPDTLEYLLLYRWPGNIRQLANELRRIVVMTERNSTIEPEHLSAFITTGTIKPAPPGVQPPQPTEVVVRMDQPLARATEHLERAMLAYALSQTGGRLEDAASLLGVSRKGLYLKRHRLGLN